MTFQILANITLDNFDDAWSLGDPIKVEDKFQELLPQAEALENKSISLQILSQIALTQALQGKFDDAHTTLDKAESALTPEYNLAKTRILLERGRVYQQEENITKAQYYFEQAFNLGNKHNFDFHTINAAHMIAIVTKETEDKIQWNQRAIDLALSTNNKRAQEWLGSLYNNLGQNYLDSEQYKKALAAYKNALEYREKEGYIPNIRFAKWAIARTLRSLNQLDEALTIQQGLLKEYDLIANSETYDMPVEMFNLLRGWIYEELAEIYDAKAKAFASLALDELLDNQMFCKTQPKRLEKLKQIQA